jgi:ADP-heptose:LPS heptosyltransferase
MKNRYDWSFNLSIQNWLDFIVLYALIPHRVTLSFQLLGPVLKFFYRIFNTKSVSYPKGAYSTEVYLSMLKFMGIKPKNSERKLYLCVEDEKMVEDLLESYELRDKKYLIGISISCGNRLKKWSEERFALLADRILDGGKAEVILTGTNDEKKDAERFFSQLKHKAIFLFGVLNLGQFAALCNKLSLFVSVDSGPLYIANAVGTPLK